MCGIISYRGVGNVTTEKTIEELKADVKELRRRIAVETEVSNEWMALAQSWKKMYYEALDEML